MRVWELLLLGFIAGGTIYIGLPLGRLRGLSGTVRAALSMLSAGILVYLLVEILGEAAGETSSQVISALHQTRAAAPALLDVILLVGGLAIGFVALVALQQRGLGRRADSPRVLPWFIALGIGLHNLSEGLAIGQSFAQGKAALAVGLVIGFALHNATEGFGIVGPALRDGERLAWPALFGLGAVGGGPTLVGTLAGGVWTSEPLSVFVLAMAGGAILYVVFEMVSAVRKETAQRIIMSALVLGFAVGWGTEVVTAASMTGGEQGSGQVVREADGDVVATGTAAGAADAGGTGQTLTLSPSAAAAQDRMAQDLLAEKALLPRILPDGTKEFVLTASAFPWQLYPGKVVEAWGYNRQVPGPLIRVRVGDKVAIVLHNELPQPTTLHLHGLAVPNGMDGVPRMKMDGDEMGTQQPIPPGGSFTYRFTVTPQMVGTHLYHTHVNDDFQMDMGLHGVILVDPAQGPSHRYDVDALYELASFKVDGSEQENAFVMDGKAFPEAPVLHVRRGQRVLIRLVNASAEEFHVMHLHGYTFAIVARDGQPLSQPEYANTVTLGPSQTADIAFVANRPGEWMFHCHILDHTVNPGPDQEGSATHLAEMGGLVTFVDVR
ncbi:multicopper oxidase domain-containing protein [Alicyclobacillus cellulosilyticus]|uniref:multicopper oxidase domain-containing protein n=1 Tax=Alicyclobacillus cellulosilyticus TaxID=1003997 RepID=UPI00166C53BB|nr:multicopper oxidase domain-containing protein [Alicyclobacillus cellulosilyticus]